MNCDDDWLTHCKALLSHQRNNALLRERKIVHAIDATHVKIDDKQFINFCANNYLGLTHHPRVIEAIKNSLGQGSGSGAAGLITGHSDLHARAESALATWKGTESAVIFPSGYQANLAAVQTLAQIGKSYAAGVRFLVDKLAHASLIDAVRSTEAPMRVFAHNQLSKLQRLLEQSDPGQLQIVLTESIFSMDGDAADLAGIARLKGKHSFVLVLDEAHASGVYGPAGAGLAAEMKLQQIVDVSVVTLSKALGCMGGAVCCPMKFRDAILNFGRAYIFSTSVAPMVAAGVEAAIHVLRDQPDRQERVRELARTVRRELRNVEIPQGDSPIIPIVLGSAQRALAVAEKLKEKGLLVVAVRPPTVSAGASRLRVTVSSQHTDQEVQQLIRAINGL